MPKNNSRKTRSHSPKTTSHSPKTRSDILKTRSHSPKTRSHSPKTRSHSPKTRSNILKTTSDITKTTSHTPKTRKILEEFHYDTNPIRPEQLVKGITYNIEDENNIRSTGRFIELVNGKAKFIVIDTQSDIRALFEGDVHCDIDCVHYYDADNKELLTLDEVKKLPDIYESAPLIPGKSYFVRITEMDNENKEVEAPFKGTYVFQTNSIKDNALDEYEEGPSTGQDDASIKAREDWIKYYPGGYDGMYDWHNYLANYFIFENCRTLKGYGKKNIIVDANNSKFYESYNLQVAKALEEKITGLPHYGSLISQYLGGRKRKNITHRKRKFAKKNL